MNEILELKLLYKDCTVPSCHLSEEFSFSLFLVNGSPPNNARDNSPRGGNGCGHGQRSGCVDN